jgi:hypothetical protein
MGKAGEVKEGPILFSGAMVRAILAGVKTMTRRIMKPQPKYDPPKVQEIWYCPYKVGDRLWVREAFSPCVCDECRKAWPKQPDPIKIKQAPHRVTYRATYAGPSGIIFRSSIFMPRWASRIMLEVTAVRAERLQEITSEDALAEGIGYDFQMNAGWPDYRHINKSGVCELTQDTPEISFATLWDTINGKRGYGWDENPFVWVISFKRIV